MEKNIFQKAKEYGLLDGYIPTRNGNDLADAYERACENFKGHPNEKQMTELYQDTAAMLRLAQMYTETMVGAYEAANPPCNIKVVAQS